MSRITKSRRSAHRSRERGQAAVFLVLALGIFLIGGVGFVVDGANLWFHRQSAQTAADAACTAGAMDLLSSAAGADITGTPSSSANSYAALNGYSSGVSVGAGTFTGLDDKACDYSNSVCNTIDSGLVASPYLQVSITDQVPTTFMRLVGAGSSIGVPARSVCGISNVLSPVPVLVLNPNLDSTMSGSGTLSVSVPASASKTLPKLIQVNSSDPNAVSTLSGTINLSNADGSQANFGIAGQSKPTADGAYTAVSAAGVVSDPFAMMASPTQQGNTQPQAGTYTPSCPESNGTSCQVYQPGHYQQGIVVQSSYRRGRGPGGQSGVAVFEPGVYYLEDNFVAGPNTCLRPAATTGALGTVFYFHNGTLQVNQSGTLNKPGFSCQSSTVQSLLLCPGSSQSNLPSSSIGGNVLLGPCEAPVGDPLHPYGDPLGQTDPLGEQRGMLFFQDRDVASAQPTWSVSGSFGLIGNLYFHNCHVSGTGDSGAGCDATAFTDAFTLGNTSGQGYIVGDVVVDQLQLSGNSNVSVTLNPNPQYYVLKASLLQ